MRHEAQMRHVGKDGTPQRAHLEAAAQRGHAGAQTALVGPPIPEALAYLWDWLFELDAARGVTMDGLAPLTYQDLDAWARLTDRHPEPHEVRALLYLDSVLRHPDAYKDEAA